MAEIETLSGRELDAMVHAAIGEPWDDSRCRVCGWPLGATRDMSNAFCSPANCCMRRHYSEHADAPPHYSRDWSGVGLVVDEMRRRGWSVVYYDRPDALQPNEWTFEKSNDVYGEAYGPNCAENCCRAALAALRAEVEAKS